MSIIQIDLFRKEAIIEKDDGRVIRYYIENNCVFSQRKSSKNAKWKEKKVVEKVDKNVELFLEYSDNERKLEIKKVG